MSKAQLPAETISPQTTRCMKTSLLRGQEEVIHHISRKNPTGYHGCDPCFLTAPLLLVMSRAPQRKVVGKYVERSFCCPQKLFQNVPAPENVLFCYWKVVNRHINPETEPGAMDAIHLRLFARSFVVRYAAGAATERSGRRCRTFSFQNSIPIKRRDASKGRDRAV